MNKLSGSAVTPFLLGAIERETGGRSLAANVALLQENASLAARIASALMQNASA
jgi:pseudouridine-5'-phosphate glycosidase